MSTKGKFATLLAVVFVLWGCPGEDPGANDEPETDAGPTYDADVSDNQDPNANHGPGDTCCVPPPDADEDTGPDPDEPEDYPVTTCDDLNPDQCAFPWPSSLYLEPDESRSTGFALTFGDESLPSNNQSTHVSPQLFDHLDGYDLGVPIMVHFPNLDDSELPDEYEIEASMEDDASVLLYEVTDDGLERIPYWVELDAFEDNPGVETLFIRPAEILKPGTRYVVALRDLEDTDGAPIEAPEAFEALVEGDTEESHLRWRQQRFDEIFAHLESEDIDPASLTLAWDFVTASSESLHGPLLTIRDDAFSFAEQQGIEWDVEDATRYSDDPEDDDHHPFIAVELEATMEVPHYMEPYEEIDDAWVLHRENGEITRNGTRQVPVYARIPHRALAGDEIGVAVYGHGLLGSRYQIAADTWGQVAEEMGVAFVAVDLVGMAHSEVDVAEQAVFDPNHFVGISDRLHQGLVEYLLLAHTAAEALPELQPDPDDVPDWDVSTNPDDTHYLGGSQGGIFGATFMAVTQDIDRGYLAVPGNNYSTLLHRSTNFVDFNEAMELVFDDSRDRNINIAVMSLLWSTTDPVSFLRHIRAEPLQDDDPRDVFLAVAKGDYQVATITNENAARSDVEIPLLENYDAERSPYGVEIASYPHQGSGTVLYDFGNPWPEAGNRPPDDDVGDPHGWLATVDAHLGQIETFLRDGTIEDICAGSPCQFDAPQ